MSAVARIAKILEILERRGVVTLDPAEREKCCGMDRDEDGFCVHRPGHPIYFDLLGGHS